MPPASGVSVPLVRRSRHCSPRVSLPPVPRGFASSRTSKLRCSHRFHCPSHSCYAARHYGCRSTTSPCGCVHTPLLNSPHSSHRTIVPRTRVRSRHCSSRPRPRVIAPMPIASAAIPPCGSRHCPSHLRSSHNCQSPRVRSRYCLSRPRSRVFVLMSIAHASIPPCDHRPSSSPRSSPGRRPMSCVPRVHAAKTQMQR